MSRLGASPVGVYSDDGTRLTGLGHPNGNQSVVTTLYNSLALLQADQAAGVLAVGDYKAGNRKFTYDGNILVEIAQKGLNNWPHVNIAHSVIRNWLNTQGANSLEQHRQALEIALPALMASTAWEKIVELWVPLGANLTGALALIKYPAGGSASLTANGTLTYTTTGGVASNGTTGYLSSASVLTTLVNNYTNSTGMVNNAWGIAMHTPALPMAGSGVAANSVLGGVVSGANYTYVSGQLANEYVFDNNVLQPIWPPYLNWANITTGNVVPPYGTGRMSWVQGGNGLVSVGCGGLQLSSETASGTNAVPAAAPTICGLTGASNLQTLPMTGYALFNTMTQAELQVLSAFFDQVNHLAYRPVLDGHLSIGDSISNGNGLGTPATQCWPALFSAMLGLTLTNYAQSGTSLSVCPFLGNTSTVNTFPSWVFTPTTNGSYSAVYTNHMLIPMASGGGSMLSLALGINDISYSGNLANYIAALTQTLTQIQQLGWPLQNLLLPSLTYATNPGGSVTNGYYTPALAVTWNAAIAQVAAEFGCIYVDMYSPINASNAATYLQADGLHPNASGHQLLAQQAYNAYAASRQNTVINYVVSN